MLFRQLFDPETSTYTYLLADEQSREAILIDPVKEQVARDAKLIDELGLTLRFVLETHVHADHVTGAGSLRELTGAKTVVSRHGGAPCADVLVDDGDQVHFGSHALEVRATPGHTDGCVSYVLPEPKMVFTGDALLIRGCGRTDFQQGSAPKLYRSVYDKLFSLPEDYAVYPGHDYQGRTSSTIAEERAHNPRLRVGISEERFSQIMRDLKLAPPKKIALAVPANQRCGVDGAQHEPQHEPPAPAPWAPIEMTALGVPEVSIDWVAGTALGNVRLVDVREPSELVGELRMLEGAESVPLAQVAARSQAWQKDEPIVLVCRSGGRSGRAAQELLSLGFSRVASMRGGMMAWAERPLPLRRVS